MLWPAAAALALALAIATSAMATAWEFNPNGDWDAWAIWNLRARVIASGELAERAWSPLLVATHPEYPLLVSGFIGRCWAFSGSHSVLVPQASAYVFFLALVSLTASGVAARRGSTLGLLAASVIAGTPSLLLEVPAQYADVPLACYFAAAVLFALMSRPLLAGIFAGFAAWTKDEGLLFLVIFLLALALWKRAAIRTAFIGASPAILTIALFKGWLARDASGLLSSSLPRAGDFVTDAGRYGTIVSAFAREFIGMSSGWYHPVLPIAVLAVALRFDCDRRGDALFTGTIAAILLLGYFGIHLITANDLAFQLQSASRLLVQLWPLLVLTAFAALRVPEAPATPDAVKAPKARTKLRRR
jgi:hypothetical protein